MSDALVLAVPSKGRLQENAAAFFARAGLDIVQGRGARDYRGSLAGLEGRRDRLSVGRRHRRAARQRPGRTWASPAKISCARRWPTPMRKCALLTPLGFGDANVVVAAPRAWIDVRTMADLEDVAASFRARRGERMRVATKYINLTRRFFAKMHVSDYRIVESSGATEGAPAAGQAELIVDITTTGATLAANALKMLDDGVILRSQANLVASLSADWSGPARESARVILSRIAAEEEARTTREVSTVLANADAAARQRGGGAILGARLRHRAADGRLTLNCPQDKVAPLADWLIAQGADHVSVAALDYVFSAANPLYEKLVARLAKTQ